MGIMAVMKDEDRDSMKTLPLAILPVETPALKRAHMIKNNKLATVIELFDGKGTGSDQIKVEGLPLEFGWSDSPAHPDFFLLK